MKKLLLGSCILSCLLLVEIGGYATAADSVASDSKTTGASTSRATQYTDANSGYVKNSSEGMNKTKNNPKSEEGADPVSKTAKDADYSPDAGNKAAQVDMGISIASAALGVVEAIIGASLDQMIREWVTTEVLSIAVSPEVPLHNESIAFGWGLQFNPIATAVTLGHAAVNKFMRDATNITASFTGAEGFVTDKWVGPHPRNTTTAIMGDISVTSEKFDALTFDPKEYEGLKDADKASARQLMDYRSEQLIQDQRSLSNVATAQWGILYRAQQRSIKGLAGALELKSQLTALGEIEKKISADYKNKPSALNTVASRRALYDALLLLKMNVMAARTKLRSETLELDFKPMTREPEIMEDDEDPTPQNVPAGPPLSPKETQ